MKKSSKTRSSLGNLVNEDFKPVESLRFYFEGATRELLKSVKKGKDTSHDSKT